jgi:galactose mutarotase-like enzyme
MMAPVEAKLSTHVESRRGVAAITLSAGAMQASFAPHLGMFGLSLRHDGDELLALPRGVAGYRAGNQAGLPLLAPWANRLGSTSYEVAGTAVDLGPLALGTDENGLPIHGTMTAQPGWEILSLGPGTVTSRFAYDARPDLLAAFPFPHELTIEATLDDGGITITTTLRPTGSVPVPVAFGWHPYLRLPGTPRRSWRLRLPERDHIELDERGLPTGRSTTEAAEDEPIGERVFDDLYALGPDRELAVHDRRRRLTVRYGPGYPFAQVFAPPGARFVCLEPMTAPTDGLRRGECPLVPVGGEFTARFAICATLA